MSSLSFRLFSATPAVLAACTIALALLASSQARAGDPIYKWKDASGHSQYSQQQPPKGVKFEIVQIAGDNGSASDAADPNAKGHPTNVPANAPRTAASNKADEAHMNPDKASQF